MAGSVVCAISRTLGMVGLLAMGTPALSATIEPVTVELRLGARAGVDPSSLRLAEETASALLARSGIKAGWRECGGAENCTTSAGAVVLVQLLSIAKLTDPTASGEAVRDQLSDVPTVLVYLPRNLELMRTMRLGSAGRSNPALATLDVGHLVGLTIAHEVGHALGLSHASSGVMKARLSIDDVIALRGSRLTFRRQESARMRLAIAAREAPVMASATGRRP